jgi:hypothetical protein
VYRVFHRTWWKENLAWPNGLEPEAGEKHEIETVETEKEARELCREWNRKHAPGRYSDKAEYEETE